MPNDNNVESYEARRARVSGKRAIRIAANVAVTLAGSAENVWDDDIDIAMAFIRQHCDGGGDVYRDDVWELIRDGGSSWCSVGPKR